MPPPPVSILTMMTMVLGWVVEVVADVEMLDVAMLTNNLLLIAFFKFDK